MAKWLLVQDYSRRQAQRHSKRFEHMLYTKFHIMSKLFNRKTAMIIGCICLLVVAFTVIQKQLKTVAGDNLGSPPWHPMRKHAFWHTVSRLHTTFGCAFSVPEDSLAKCNSTTIQPRPWPSYFNWIFEDLAPWRLSGITPETLEAAKRTAAFRVVIHQGKLYPELYYRCFQSRMMFTLWGLLNLLDRFPGNVPDVDLYFNCQDKPQVHKKKFPASDIPPPLFGYCSTDQHFDIPFPDFSFWGWPEVKIKPWKEELMSIVAGSQELEWADKDDYAYWRGNAATSVVRKQLLKCNSSDYRARIYAHDWIKEINADQTKLNKQCSYRYKIYVEGYAWSASYKYLLACGSPLLVVNSKYYEFFTRGLVPHKDFLPIGSEGNLCKSIKGAVEWGDSHPIEAQAMGSRGRKFVEENLSMDHVYGYMLYLLEEYAKLQKFKPLIPVGSTTLSHNVVLCVANQIERDYLQQSNC